VPCAVLYYYSLKPELSIWWDGNCMHIQIIKPISQNGQNCNLRLFPEYFIHILCMRCVMSTNLKHFLCISRIIYCSKLSLDALLRSGVWSKIHTTPVLNYAHTTSNSYLTSTSPVPVPVYQYSVLCTLYCTV
jgi:hypothetical protein